MIKVPSFFEWWRVDNTHQPKYIPTIRFLLTLLRPKTEVQLVQDCVALVVKALTKKRRVFFVKMCILCCLQLRRSNPSPSQREARRMTPDLLLFPPSLSLFAPFSLPHILFFTTVRCLVKPGRKDKERKKPQFLHFRRLCRCSPRSPHSPPSSPTYFCRL